MKVCELRERIVKFHDDLERHQQLWGRSLNHTLPEYPIRNVSEIRSQVSDLARQLGAIRGYFDSLEIPTTMGNAYGHWDAFHSAISNDVAIRKGSSIEAILPQLQQAIGRLDTLQPDSEFVSLRQTQKPTVSTGHVTNIYNVSGANSRVNIASSDDSINVSSITEQQVFAGIRRAINTELPEAERASILEKLDAMESLSTQAAFSRNTKPS